MKRYILIIVLSLLLAGCGNSEETVQENLNQTTYALGTVININLYDQGNQEIMDEMIAKVAEIEKLMSAQQEASEISEVTRQAGISPVAVSEETFSVVSRALHYAEVSGGRFDPTIGPIVDLWGIGTEDARVPSQEEIDQALALVDYTKVLLDEENKTVYLSEEGMSLDLGGIAKGYTADALAAILRAGDVERAMINLGGNIFAFGEKADGSTYKIAVQTPYDARNKYFGYIEGKDITVVTSGPYERYFEQDGKMYHHIFDAKTGYPTKGDVVSVSVVASVSMDADALSTVLFTMSPEEGLALINGMDDVECIYVDDEYGLLLSDGLKDVFTVTDSQYTIR